MADFRLQILFLIPSLRGGGAERVIVTLLRHMDRELFRLALAVVDMRNATYRDDILDDVELIDLDCLRVRYALPKIMRLIWMRRPDVVFSTLGHLNMAIAIVRPLLPSGVRFVARETVVVSQALKQYSFPRVWATAYRWFYSRFDCVVCQSMDMHRDLVMTYQVPLEKTVIIHNPIDIAHIYNLINVRRLAEDDSETPRKDALRISLVAAGRLAYQKGFDILIEALAICRDSSLHLTILGEGPLLAELQRLAHERGVAEQVKFAGFQENPYPFLALADAFILSSRYEGFPNVVLEALACGTPVIATPAPGGVAEIAELTGGVLLASSVTAYALSVAIKQFISDNKSAAPITLSPFFVESIVDQYQRLLISAALPSFAAVNARQS